ncbi:MAG TPA: N-acetyltransferase [Planctomycetaceae bacterium]|nr:N-acetyltransferase [Planctomycetaceae bacterium]
MTGVRFPTGWHVETLAKPHNRRSFTCGNTQVDRWLRQSALQSQKKHLSVTKVLLDENDTIVGFYTLATSQVDFSDLPPELSRVLPRRQLPVAVLAWLGIASRFQSQGLGKRILAMALRDCFDASQSFAFVAVLLDCVDDSAKKFYRQFDFDELPGHPMRLYLSFRMLEGIMKKTSDTEA